MLRKILFLSVSALLWRCAEKKPVDLLVYNARIYTVDANSNMAEAMVIRDGRIVETGSNENMLHKFEPAHRFNAENNTIVPGFIDAHCHFTGYATDMWKCNLVGTTSFEEVLERVMIYAENAPMRWIYCRGWDQNDWEDKTFPDNSTLNKLFPNRPVFLKRIDGHAALVNKVALDLAGINAKTVVKGGKVELMDGKPTGLLIDNAMDLVDKLVPRISDSLAAVYYRKAQQACFRFGLTQVQDCGINEHTVELLDAEQKAGRLQMKVFALLNDDSAYYDKWINKGIYRTKLLTVGGFKLYADGALGSRGACLLSPYHDKPAWHGFMLRDRHYLANVAQKLAATNFQLCTHAIGDSANRVTLHIYGKALDGKKDKRWRIEHAQVVNAQDFELFGRYDVIPSVQPTHATSDMYWAAERLGTERVKTAYAYQRLLKSAGRLPLGTDFPVESISPFKTFYAATMRKDAQGYPAGGFQAAQALTRDQALRGMTIWASYAIFEDSIKGSLEKNKVADFVILDNDIMRCPENDILKTKVLATYLDGQRVY